MCRTYWQSLWLCKLRDDLCRALTLGLTAAGPQPPLQNESRRETIFGQLLDRRFKDEESTKTMAMIDE